MDTDCKVVGKEYLRQKSAYDQDATKGYGTTILYKDTLVVMNAVKFELSVHNKSIN